MISFLLYTLKEYEKNQMEEKQVLFVLYQQEWLQILKEGCTMVNLVDMTKERAEELVFTDKELEELERARSMPITFDEDCPETTSEIAVKFRRVNPPTGHQKNLV